MAKSNDDSMLFPQKLMEILADPSNQHAISWLPTGKAFVIHDRDVFAQSVMPKYFSRQAKYSSFTRKLNRWNFLRVAKGPESGAYYHHFFLRDKPHLAAQMFCKNARTILAMASNEKKSTKEEVPKPVVANDYFTLPATGEPFNNSTMNLPLSASSMSHLLRKSDMHTSPINTNLPVSDMSTNNTNLQRIDGSSLPLRYTPNEVNLQLVGDVMHQLQGGQQTVAMSLQQQQAIAAQLDYLHMMRMNCMVDLSLQELRKNDQVPYQLLATMPQSPQNKRSPPSKTKRASAA